MDLADVPLLSAFLRRAEDPISDYTPANTLMWAGPWQPFRAIIDNCLCQFALTGGGLTVLRPPFGDGDRAAALREAVEICREHNDAAGLGPVALVEYVNEAFLARCPMGGWDREPAGGDYVYETRRLIDLEGGDLASKRQMRNRFARRYAARVEPYTPALRHVCNQLLAVWDLQVGQYAGQVGESADAKRGDDLLATNWAIDHYAELGLTGMVLWAGDQPAGFTFGEPLGDDSFSVLIEKTDRDLTGSANYIYSEFCRQHFADRRWCNAGDDWGIENLVRVKESYRPVGRLFKFNLRPPVPVRVAVPMDLPGRFDASVPVGSAERNDLDALVRLEQSEFAGEDPFSRRQLRYLLTCPRASTHLVREDGEVIASAVLLRRRTRAGMVGRLYSLCVASAHRGRGIGRMLLDDVIAACRRESIARLRLEVRADNTPAIALYSRAGFQVEGHLTDYYGVERHGLKMRLDLKEEGAKEINSELQIAN